MSDSNRGKRSQDLAEQGDGAQGSEQGPNRNDNPSDQQAGGAPSIVEQMPSPSKASEGLQQAQSEQPAPHTMRDLIAQETMAEASFWMAAAAVGTMIVSLFGTFLIWRQVRLTREAVEDTGEATAAMVEANRIASKTSHHQLRAYVGLDALELRLLPSGASLVHPVWKNSGQTPALNAFHNTAYFLGNGLPDDGFDFPENKYPPQANAIYPGHINRIIGPTISSHDIARIKRNELSFVVYGWIEYDDIFGFERHRTEFVSRLAIDQKGWEFIKMTTPKFGGVDATARDCITARERNDQNTD